MSKFDMDEFLKSVSVREEEKLNKDKKKKKRTFS